MPPHTESGTRNFAVGYHYWIPGEPFECELCGLVLDEASFVIFPPEHPSLTFCVFCAFQLRNLLDEVALQAKPS